MVYTIEERIQFPDGRECKTMGKYSELEVGIRAFATYFSADVECALIGRVQHVEAMLCKGHEVIAYTEVGRGMLHIEADPMVQVKILRESMKSADTFLLDEIISMIAEMEGDDE